MFNNNCGFGFSGEHRTRPRFQQIIQVNYQPIKTHHIAVERPSETILKQYARTGSNSTLTIPKVDQLLNTYSSPVAATSAMHLKPSWPPIRSKSINMVEPINMIPQANTTIDRRQYTPLRNAHVYGGPTQSDHYRLQSQIMGGSCISKTNTKSKLSHRPNKVQQSIPKEQPVVIPIEPIKKFVLDSTLLDSDNQNNNEGQSEIELPVQRGDPSEESLFGIMDKINLGYYPFSEDSYSRHLEKILECVRQGSKVNWYRELDEVIKLRPQQQLPRILELRVLYQQFFKWYAYTIIIFILSPPQLELFHQDLNLHKQIADLLKKNIKEENYRVRQLHNQPTNSYSDAQLRKGVRIGELSIKMVSYMRSIEIQKAMTAESNAFLKSFDFKQVKFELLAIYRGCRFHITPTKTRLIRFHDQPGRGIPKYIIAIIPQNTQEPIRFECSMDQGSSVVRQFEERCPNFTTTSKWRKSHLSLVFLSKPHEIEAAETSQNLRANRICSFLGGNALFQNDVYLISKRRLDAILKPSLQEFERTKHLIRTHRMLSDLCDKLGLSIFDVLRFRENTKLRPILTTTAIIKAIKFLFMDILSHDYTQQLYKLIRELLSYEMTELKQRIFIYLNFELIFSSDTDFRETAEEIMTSPHWFSVEFFEGLYHEFGVDLDSLVLKIKKDSTYLTYNMSEFKSINLDYNLIFKQSICTRDVVFMLLMRCLKDNKQSTGLIVQNRNIRMSVFSTISDKGKLIVPSLQVIESWCNITEAVIGKIRSVNGQQGELLLPFIIKLTIQIILKLPFQQTHKKVQRLFNALALCSPEITISVMSLLALASEMLDKTLSEQYYIRTIALMHRTYCDPRARNNTYHPWEVFLTARLINTKRIAGKQYEVEYLTDLMECMMGDAVSQRPYQPKNPGQSAFPFPTIIEEGSKPFTISVADLLEWILTNIPIVQHSDLLYKKSEISKNDLNRSNLSTQSRSTASRKDRPINEYLEKNEATIEKDNYLGVIIIGNGRRHVSIYWPLKNLIIHKIACGIAHTIASTLDGLYGWGYNESGQLGEQPGGHLRKMCNINAVVSKLSCGSEHSCAVISGRLKMWGQKQGGIVSGDGYAFDDVACGGLHSVALKDGEVYSWGRGQGGQLGHPLNILQTKQGAQSTQYFLSQPRKIRGLSKIKKVACGDAHTLALAQDGRVYVFGFSYQGQLGLGLTGDSEIFQIFEPIRLDYFGNTKIVDIASGSTYSVFVTERQEIFSCGLNDFHQIGIDKAVTVIQKRLDRKSEKYKKQRRGQIQFSIPNKLDYFSDSFNIRKVTCGENHTIACVDYMGQQLYVGWGMNKHQQLGIQYCISTTPRTISNIQRVPISQICCGNTFTLAAAGSTGDRISLRKLIMESGNCLGLWKFKRL